MGNFSLERFESVNLYSIGETQLVIELDSPAIGTEFIIAKREAVYEFFPSEGEAQRHIRVLRERYQSENPTLQLKTEGPRFERSGSWLEGEVNHQYAHAFEINHSVNCQTLPSSELLEDLEILLNNPKRRILKDERNHPNFPEYLKIPKPDFDKIILF